MQRTSKFADCSLCSAFALTANLPRQHGAPRLRGGRRPRRGRGAMLSRSGLRIVSVAAALLCVLNLLRQVPYRPSAQQADASRQHGPPAWPPTWVWSCRWRPGPPIPCQASRRPPRHHRLLFLFLFCCCCRSLAESERLVQQLFVPLLGRLAPDAPAPAEGNASLAASHNSSTAAAMCRVGGGQHWRERCFGEGGKLRPEVQLVTTPHRRAPPSTRRDRARRRAPAPDRAPRRRVRARRFVEWRVPEPPRDPTPRRRRAPTTSARRSSSFARCTARTCAGATRRRA